MTHKELASYLDGQDLAYTVPSDLMIKAKRFGLVIIKLTTPDIDYKDDITLYTEAIGWIQGLLILNKVNSLIQITEKGLDNCSDCQRLKRCSIKKHNILLSQTNEYFVRFQMVDLPYSTFNQTFEGKLAFQGLVFTFPKANQVKTIHIS